MLNGIEPPNKTKNDSHLWDTMLHKNCVSVGKVNYLSVMAKNLWQRN